MFRIGFSADLLSFCVAASSQTAAYSVSTFDVPGASATFARSLNASGEIAGYYYGQLTPGGPSHSFLRDSAGAITVFDPPGAAMSSAFGINDFRQVAGQWSPDLIGNTQHAYVRASGGALSSFDAPGSQVTGAYGINDSGQMTVNALTEPGPYQTLLREADGTYSAISVAGSSSALLAGLSNRGVAVGTIDTFFESGEAFLAAVKGAPLTFAEPAGNGTTRAFGINDENTVVGSFNTGSGYQQISHGFIREADGSYIIFDMPGASQTVLYDINDRGELVGTFTDSTGMHGFLAMPCGAPRAPGPAPAVAVILPAGACATAPRRTHR